MQILRRSIAMSILLALVAISGCSVGERGPEAGDTAPNRGTTNAAPETADPPPVIDDSTSMVFESSGGTFTADEVTVAVPEGASSTAITISSGREVGPVDDAYMQGHVGVPIRVDHDTDLSAPLDISWNVASDAAKWADLAILVRWDEDGGAWAASSERIELVDGSLTASVRDFSIVSWFVANTQQKTGELFGTRSGAPECNGRPLPDWVRSAAGSSEANVALRVCFEPDSRDSILTVRSANNRPFAQTMTLTDGDRYAWVWNGPPTIDPATAVQRTLGTIINAVDNRVVVLPATAEVAVGLARPGPAAPLYSTRTAANWQSVLVDLIGRGVDQISIGGAENPLLDVFLQLIYECAGGRMIVKNSDAIGDEMVSILVGCASLDISRVDGLQGGSSGWVV